MNMEEARRYCLKLERDRERSWRGSRQGAFEASMLSLDDPSMRRTDGEDSPAWESDGGKGAESVYGADAEGNSQKSVKEQSASARRLLGRKSKRLIQVFDLLVATRARDDKDNPKGDDVSSKEVVIRGLMKRNGMARKVAQTVFLREMKKLERMFLPNKDRGLIDVSGC